MGSSTHTVQIIQSWTYENSRCKLAKQQKEETCETVHVEIIMERTSCCWRGRANPSRSRMISGLSAKLVPSDTTLLSSATSLHGRSALQQATHRHTGMADVFAELHEHTACSKIPQW